VCALEVESVASALPAIVFIVFFLVYQDQGFLKPYLGQPKKTKDYQRWRKLSYDPMNDKQQTNQRSTHAYVQAQEPVTALDDTRMPNQPVKIQQMKPKRS
jgi:hypothetical protein